MYLSATDVKVLALVLVLANKYSTRSLVFVLLSISCSCCFISFLVLEHFSVSVPVFVNEILTIFVFDISSMVKTLLPGSRLRLVPISAEAQARDDKPQRR